MDQEGRAIATRAAQTTVAFELENPSTSQDSPKASERSPAEIGLEWPRSGKKMLWRGTKQDVH